LIFSKRESINRNNQSEATKAKKNLSCVVLRALDHVIGSDLLISNKDAIVKFAMKMFVNNNALSGSVIYLLDDELINEDCRVEMLAVYLEFTKPKLAVDYNLTCLDFHIIAMTLNCIHQTRRLNKTLNNAFSEYMEAA
jgi:hypothetical protein